MQRESWKKACVSVSALIVTVGVIAPFVIFGAAWGLVSTDGSIYNFWDFELEFRYIALIMGVGLFVPGLFGSVLLWRGYVKKNKLQKKETNKISLAATMSRRQATGMAMCALIVISWGFMIGSNYFPSIPENLGWVQPTYGPYLQYGADGSILVSWDSPTQTDSSVEWGVRANDLNATSTGREFYTEIDGVSFHHCVRIPGLTANQNYYYRISSISPQIYKFHTALFPSTVSSVVDPVIFTIVGDTQVSYHISAQNVARMRTDPDKLDFTVIVGDVVHADNNMKEWDKLFGRDSYGRIASETPLMVVPGNHEDYDFFGNPSFTPRGHFYTYFQNIYPESSPRVADVSQVGYFYSWNYSNVHMVALDSFAIEKDVLSTRQVAWLKADLAKNSGMWKFLYMHVPVYSLMNSEFGLPFVHQMEAICYEYGVDVVFTGHEHDFCAFQVNHTSTDSGIFHFTLGGGGGTLEQFDLPAYAPHQWPGKHITSADLGANFDDLYARQWFVEGELTHHYMKVEVTGETAIFTAIRTTDGAIIGNYTATR